MSGSDRLRREIESLLRWPMRGAVEPRLRGPVLGMRSSAAALVPDQPEQPSVPPIDHGWATGTYDDTVIYTWSSLAATLAAQGYVIGPSGEYASVVTRAAGQTELYPEEFSGLTRLLAQAFNGAGRDLVEIVPPGWTVQLKQLGLVRSPGGVYWLCNIGVTIGLRMTRLVVPDNVASLAAAVNAGTLPADERELAEAVVVGSLVLADPVDSVTVLSMDASQFAAVYRENFVDQHWGWCWRYQRRGAPDEHVCGAVVKTEAFTAPAPGYCYLRFRESVLAVTFVSERPAAAITETVRGYTQAPFSSDGVFLLWRLNNWSIPDQNALRTWVWSGAKVLIEPPDSATQRGLLASCYGPDGTVQRLEMVGRGTSVGNSGSVPDSKYWCPAWVGQDYNNSVITRPVFEFGGEILHEATPRVQTSSSVENWNLTCPPKNGSVQIGNGTKSFSTTKPVSLILAGPGLVFCLAYDGNEISDQTWTLELKQREVSCFCDGRPYDLTARMIINNAMRFGSGYLESWSYSSPNARLGVSNHGQQEFYDDSGAVYAYLSDLRARASTTHLQSCLSPYKHVAASYHGNINLLGSVFPDGMDDAGAELDGHFAGGV